MKSLPYVSAIQRFCVHDGPGIRTVVFLMGCPLRCKWCQNPENFKPRPMVMFDSSKCIACGECVACCPKGCNVIEAGVMRFDASRCDGCGECVKACYSGARSVCGERKTPDELFDEVMEDEVFFRESGGGITFSGGEATMHAEYVAEVMHKFRDVGISTAIETSGFCSPSALQSVAEYTDCFLYDVKLRNEESHLEWTGVRNERILENLRTLCVEGRRVIARIALIPGVNDGDEFVRILEYLRKFPNVDQVHILPFHQIGSSKYGLTQTPYDMADVPECPDSIAEKHVEIARSFGFKVNVGGWDVSAEQFRDRSSGSIQPDGARGPAAFMG